VQRERRNRKGRQAIIEFCEAGIGGKRSLFSFFLDLEQTISVQVVRTENLEQSHVLGMKG
jgi:hypothetical protein